MATKRITIFLHRAQASFYLNNRGENLSYQPNFWACGSNFLRPDPNKLL